MSTFLSILVLCITIWYTTCQTGAGEDEVIIKKRYIWTDPLAIGSRFAFDLANEECASVASGFASIDDCLNGTTIAIQYAKLVLAYQTSYKAVDIITNNAMIPMAAEWQKGVEGNSFAYSAKVRMLQEIADDPRIVRICEVGFNMGHSSMNWLVSNPIVEVLSFDITRTVYTPAAINAIHQLFPKRVVTLITGDSATSVPNFAQFMYGNQSTSSVGVSHAKFNIIFIDGNHEYEGALLDIMNLRPMANATYHRILVDDGLHPEVRRAWDHAADVLGIVRTLAIKPVMETTCTTTRTIPSGPLAQSVEFVSCAEDGIFWHFDDVIIGEYV